MRNEKKIAFQQRQIEELKKQVDDLTKENIALSSQLEANKTSILLREKALEDKEAQLDETKSVYERTIEEVRALQNKYNQCIKDAQKARDKYVTEMKQQLKRISRQK